MARHDDCYWTPPSEAQHIRAPLALGAFARWPSTSLHRRRAKSFAGFDLERTIGSRSTRMRNHEMWQYVKMRDDWEINVSMRRLPLSNMLTAALFVAFMWAGDNKLPMWMGQLAVRVMAPISGIRSIVRSITLTAAVLSAPAGRMPVAAGGQEGRA